MLKKTYLLDETPGSLSNIYEIKILICHILNEIKKITKNQICSVLLINETVNYFNFCQALKELKEKNQIIEKSFEEKKQLQLTPLGKQMLNSLKDEMPKSIMKKTIFNVKKFLEEERENKNKKIEIKEKSDGYSVKLTLEEIESNLMDLELFCPNLKIAKNVKKQMKIKTTEIYAAIISIINNDYNSLFKITSNLKKEHNNLNT